MIYVVAALLRKNNRILLAQRSYGELTSYWEFPGGKIDKNESPFNAIIREIKEELGLNILPIKKIKSFKHEYPFGKIKLFLIKCKLEPADQSVTLKGSHANHAWVKLNTKLKLAPLDKKILKYLKLKN